MITKLLKIFISKESVQQLINKITGIFNINLLELSHKEMGIYPYNLNLAEIGEKFVLEEVLPILIDKENPVLFDVGANNGRTTIDFRNAFPQAFIYAFEPNKKTFSLLEENTKGLKIYNMNYALGASEENKRLYSFRNDVISGRASLYKDAFTTLYKSNEIEPLDIEITTLDIFSKRNKISYIDFLKIDTEGHDFFVLKGAKSLLDGNNLGIIQFEFNDLNVISRIFLKDFYDLLPDYYFYRMCKKKLIRIGEYNTKNEIFKFQDILAIHKKDATKINVLM